jgi:hypothetical protein
MIVTYLLQFVDILEKSWIAAEITIERCTTDRHLMAEKKDGNRSKFSSGCQRPHDNL